jgi:hypothetical protein
LKGLAQTLNLLPGTIPGKAKEEEDNQDDENPPKPPPAEGLTLGRSWHGFYTSFTWKFSRSKGVVKAAIRL